MQFFLVAPFLVYPYVVSKSLGELVPGLNQNERTCDMLRGWATLSLATLGSTAANIGIALSGHYSASPLFDSKYFAHIYVQPYTRAQPYLVGIALAFAWDQWGKRLTATSSATSALIPASEDQTSVVAEKKGGAHAVWHPYLVWGLCLGASAAMLANMFGTYGLYQNYPTDWTDAQNVTYISLSRLGWAIALNVIAFLCFAKQLPLVNAVLSFGPFEIFGKLTYAAYIISGRLNLEDFRSR
eukprot:6650515-Prymnesium_polylepis.1